MKGMGDGVKQKKDRCYGREISIRDRVAGLYLMVTASLIVMVFILVYVLVEHHVYSHIDEELEEVAHEFVESLQVTESGLTVEDQTEWMERSLITVDFSPKFVQVVAAGNSTWIIKKSFNLFSDTLQYNPALDRAAFYNATIVDASVRQVQIPVFHDEKPRVVAWVLAAVPLEESLLILSDLRMVLLVSLLAMLLIVFAVTRVITGKSIAPLEKVIETAERITQENLDERIELPQKRDELYRLASTINDLLNRLQAVYTRERQFTADASHELKTPLASVLGTLEVLVRKPRNPAHYAERIDFCIDELRRMSGMVEQLLFLARYDSASFVPEVTVFDVRQTVLNVLKRVDEQTKEKELQMILENDGNTMVRADASMLEIMIGNVVSNAVKFSGKGEPVTIAIERKNASVVCSVKDTGPGIPAEKVDRIFERFYRVDESRNAQISGAGLGLAIVKKLADLQQITVRLSSRRNKGTTVVLEIPAA